MDSRQNDDVSWEWQGEDLYLQADTNFDDASKCVWTGVTQNGEDISYMFEDSTPIKSCGDFTYQFDDCDIMTKTPQECKEYSSQIKRRRLDFASEEISSSFLKSKERINAHGVVLPELYVCLEDDFSPTNIEDLGQTEAWLAVADCLNDTDLNACPDDGDAPTTPDVQVDVKEGYDVTPDPESRTVQRPVRSSRNIIFKGRKSYMRTPSKVASSVAYPFDFVKPSGVRGDVTLKDINQRIHTPPPKPKEVEEPVVYPTSAFSGKPVVGKTKIPTQGGKGSITIMRTKG